MSEKRLCLKKPERKMLMAEALRIFRQEDSELTNVELITRAQLALPVARRRVVNHGFAWTIVSDMKKLEASGHLKPAPAPPLPEAAVPPAPVPDPGVPGEPAIITIEVPRAMTFAEMLNACDVPSLSALLAAKLEQQANLTHLLLREIAAKVGGSNLPPVAPFKPNAEIYAAVTARKATRIALIGPLTSQFQEIKKQVEDAHLPAELRYYDKDHHVRDFGHCDFVICTRHNNHRSLDCAHKQVGHERVFYVDHGITLVVQKIRDLCSRQGHN